MVRSPIESPISSVLRSALGLASGGVKFSPLDIASCRLLLDGSDIATMFTNTAGTTPVTASGQVVKAWRDKTTNATLFTEATNAPTYTEASGLKYLSFPGNVFLTASMNLSAVNAITICCGARRLAASDMTIINHNGSNAPSFTLDTGTSGSVVKAISRGDGSGRTGSNPTQSLSASPKTDILTGFCRISSALAQTRLNGVNGTAVTSGQGAGNFSNANVRIGFSLTGVRYWNGPIYGLTMFTSILSEDDLDKVEAWLAERSGVTL